MRLAQVLSRGDEIFVELSLMVWSSSFSVIPSSLTSLGDWAACSSDKRNLTPARHLTSHMQLEFSQRRSWNTRSIGSLYAYEDFQFTEQGPNEKDPLVPCCPGGSWNSCHRPGRHFHFPSAGHSR